jgi:hypothetical protein
VRQLEIDRTAREHDECERGLGGVDAVGASDEEADLGVHALDPAVADALLQGIHYDPSTLAHGASRLHERGETIANGSCDPAIEEFDGVGRLEVAGEYGAELLLHLVSAPDAAAVALEGRELVGLSLGPASKSER